MNKRQHRHKHKGFQSCEKRQPGSASCGRDVKDIQCGILKRMGENPDPQAAEPYEEAAPDETHHGRDKDVARAVSHRCTERLLAAVEPAERSNDVPEP